MSETAKVTAKNWPPTPFRRILTGHFLEAVSHHRKTGGLQSFERNPSRTVITRQVREKIECGENEQEYLAEGFAEEIINGHSRCPHIVVIARNSSFVYKANL